jgi:alpha-galactosidase
MVAALPGGRANAAELRIRIRIRRTGQFFPRVHRGGLLQSLLFNMSTTLFDRALLALCAAALLLAPGQIAAQTTPAPAATPEIRTPKPAATPRLNGPAIFGVRPGHPLLYRIPATGERPMEFAIDGLPAGLKLDAQTGQITGSLPQTGEFVVTLRAKNAKGADAKKFKIVVGETIALTPAMGWNSWNHYHGSVSAEIVLANAKAMVSSGLANHGWTYLNIDDAWQGKRDGEFHGIQGNEKFPDMKGLADAVHALGLKIGLYSTPWVQSYAGYIGGTAENPEGTFVKTTGPKKPNQKILPWSVGKYSFAKNDAQQWGAWGFDYLKYDWNPSELPETKEMYDALRASGRDIVFSLSNNARPGTLIERIAEIRPFASSWRIAGDIKSNWKSVSDQARRMDAWQKFAGPGHRNDPDMLEIGTKETGQPGLTPDEEYSHMTWWCLFSAPLLLGNDLTELNEFTLNILTNDEVIAVNQDELGQQAAPVAKEGDLMVYAKPLADGSLAVGLFNLGTAPAKVSAKWADLKLQGKQTVRDLWRQKDLGQFEGEVSVTVAPHSAELVKLSGK